MAGVNAGGMSSRNPPPPTDSGRAPRVDAIASAEELDLGLRARDRADRGVVSRRQSAKLRLERLEVVAALEQAAKVKDGPTAIVSQTKKGFGILPVLEEEGDTNYHGKPLPPKLAEKALKLLA